MQLFRGEFNLARSNCFFMHRVLTDESLYFSFSRRHSLLFLYTNCHLKTAGEKACVVYIFWNTELKSSVSPQEFLPYLTVLPIQSKNPLKVFVFSGYYCLLFNQFLPSHYGKRSFAHTPSTFMDKSPETFKKH